MKKILGFFVLALLFSGFVTADELQLDYKVSVYDPLNRPVVDDVYCVGTTLYVNVTNHFTHKPLNNAQVTAYVNGTTMMVNTYTYNGIALVNIKAPGLYRLRIWKTTYENVLSGERYNFTFCTSTTTTTSTTTSTTTTTTTIEPVSTTLSSASTTSSVPITSSMTTTLPAESCSDDVKNQDEAGVDCGGSCAPCSQMDFTGILIAVLLIAIVGVIVYFLVKGGEKDRGAGKGHKEHANHKHHAEHGEAKK
jgi:hypothetical protein